MIPKRLTLSELKSRFPKCAELQGYCPVTYQDGRQRQVLALVWVQADSSTGISGLYDNRSILIKRSLSFNWKVFFFFLELRCLWHFIYIVVIPVVQVLGHVWLFATPWTAAHQASLSFTISWNLLKLTEPVLPSNHLILCHPLLLLPSVFPGCILMIQYIVVFVCSFVFQIRSPSTWKYSLCFRISWSYIYLWEQRKTSEIFEVRPFTKSQIFIEYLC